MELAAVPLKETVERLRAGAADLHDWIDAQCDRIDRLDGELLSLLPEEGRRSRLHAEAEYLLARYPEPGERPPLFGALVGVKDILHVDGMVTRAGTGVPPEEFAGSEEGGILPLLRAAGALVLGKTVTTEFAYFEPGPTRNPHNLAHTPGGSSSGSAAAVAAGLAPLALGTQTIGSVIRPASFCGVVGFKPSARRIPTGGLVYYSPTLDHVGLFTQDAAGMALAASAVCAGWRGIESGLPGRVAVLDDAWIAQAGPEMQTAQLRWSDALRRAGVEVVTLRLFPEITTLNLRHRRLANGEFARQMATIAPRHWSALRPRTQEAIEMGRGVSDGELDNLRAMTLELRAELRVALDAAEVDLILCPAAVGPAPEGLAATGDPNMNLPWTTAGMPAITVPGGRSKAGLPLGAQLVGRFGEDESLLGWTVEIEQRLAVACPYGKPAAPRRTATLGQTSG